MTTKLVILKAAAIPVGARIFLGVVTGGAVTLALGTLIWLACKDD